MITLTYRALVPANTPAGTYNTVASVKGYGDSVIVVATDDDTDAVRVALPAVLGRVRQSQKRLRRQVPRYMLQF